jgi:NAD(P)H-flavin reductase
MAQIADQLARQIESDPMVPRLMTVERARYDNYDTFSMELVNPDGSPFLFHPGQFNMIGVLGVGEVPISISGDPDKPQVLVHTTREVGATTRALGRVQPGGMVTIRGPFGHPWPIEQAEGKDLLLVAGGIGLAPLRPVIYHVMNHRARFGRFHVLYGARTPKDMLFEKEVARWRSQFDVDFIVTVDRGDAVWRGNVGVVTHLIPRIPVDPERTVVMICGPEIMIRFTAKVLLDQGLRADQMYASLERDMKCGIGLCGHCQVRGEFICRDGPVYRYADIAPLMAVREL